MDSVNSIALHPRTINLAGSTIKGVKVLNVHSKRGHTYYWNCICHCGATRVLSGSSFRGISPSRCNCRGRNLSKLSLEEHLEALTQKTDACWLWTGPRIGDGRGHISHRGKIYLAPRVSWEVHRGPIPEGMYVCHNCPGGDNPACVNPDHLFLGTHQDNMRDRDAKGRGARGERHARARMTDEMVFEILTSYAGGEDIPSLRKRYGVQYATIRDIVWRRTWKHVAFPAQSIALGLRPPEILEEKKEAAK